MKKIIVFIVLFCIGLISYANEKAAVTAEEALQKLEKGNKRYVTEKFSGENRNNERRKETAAGQHPFAVILTCSDSRVPPELIFDQGIGDVFIIRDAGNVADKLVLGSIEYGVEHLGAPLVVVMGHKKCGAVSAAVSGGETTENIGAILEIIKPSVDAVKDKIGDKVDNAVKENIIEMVKLISESKPIMEEKLKEGKVKIIGAYYDIESGKVEFIK